MIIKFLSTRYTCSRKMQRKVSLVPEKCKLGLRLINFNVTYLVYFPRFGTLHQEKSGSPRLYLGCQMAYFQTKNSYMKWVNYGGSHNVGRFYGHLVNILWQLGKF
jgi:hypothetical protein